MPLNKSKGNMYTFITDTWNTIKGKCPHDCLYCYMKKWGEQPPVRLDKEEFKTDLGSGKFIFVGSSCDMFAHDIPREWIEFTLWHCKEHPGNKYFFQSKNPYRFLEFIKTGDMPENFSLCTTIETDFLFFPQMGNTINPHTRAESMRQIKDIYADIEMYVTIEPLIDFEHVHELTRIIKKFKPIQVNIGADTGGHKMPEPSKDKVLKLIEALSEFTVVNQKKNLKRLLK